MHANMVIASTTSASPSSACLLIAVVEDDRAVLKSLEFTLEAQGYAVCTFDCVAAALASDEIHAADCLVIDYALPDGDGATLLQSLRDRGVTCPAIIIASNPTVRCLRDTQACGAPLVEKPLMTDLLFERIRAAVERA